MEVSSTGHKFGTFAGVFTPTVLTILGAIMYLRQGWVVGNAGLGGAVLIVLLANVITICTALSIASIATNIRVRAGGAFSIISQSLGLEVGGSVSVPFYLAQAISVSFYIFAFTEGWQRIFPEHPEVLVIFGAFGVAFMIAYISASVAARTQFLILAVVVASLVSVFVGTFQQEELIDNPAIIGEFQDGGFWEIFAVFFPAVTGVLAGVNMSGNLKDPRRSLPLGTLSAIILSMGVYVALAFWFAVVSPPGDLIDNLTIIVDKAAFEPAVLAGILAATFSSALTSLVGAPRVLQAIAQHSIIPGGDWLAVESRGEPRAALFVTGGIGLASLVFGLISDGLNAIAPLMTMFFLITYAVLNGVVLLEQNLDLVSFRPGFRVPRVVSLIGLAGSLFVMFLINAIFSLVALVVIIGLYAYLSRRHLVAPWSDVRSGLFVTLAEWAAKRVTRMPSSQERAWKPNLLVPIQHTDELLGSYRFLKALTYPRGSIHALGLYETGYINEVQGIPEVVEAFSRIGIFSRSALLEVEDFGRGLRIGLEVLRSAFFRPNALFMELHDDTDEEWLQALLERARNNEIGAILFYNHPTVGLGRERTINVWIREQSPQWEVGLRLSHLDLALLLAYQIDRNWQGNINLITIVKTPDEIPDGEAFLSNLISGGRMPAGTRAVVETGTLQDYMPQAPRADLHFFGVQPRIKLQFVQDAVRITHASCIFVQDSGHESALA